jgi:glycolate dehydrogenase FAD-linked subunit
MSIAGELRGLLGEDAVPERVPARYLVDETESRGLRGRADAVVLPRDAGQVAEAVAWCYEREVPIVPRGGGTGYAGGAVPLDGGVVVSLERLDRICSFEPLLWRLHVEAGVTTGDVRRNARESGLYYPPDPGAAEQSQIGGNVATNAGGPHAFKYGATGAWVTGLEAVVAPGEPIAVGGPFRKDVAGYDLKSLLVGSEGTLGIVTAVRLRLIPAPEAAVPVISAHASTRAGCDAVERVVGSGLAVAALEYLDAETMRLAPGPFPIPDRAFVVLAEVDGSREEVARLRAELVDVLGEHAIAVHAPETREEIDALWRWRDGVSLSVRASRGGKAGEDIVVPLERLAEAIDATAEIGRSHRLPSCSWGHAGDGNLHSNFLLAPGDADELARAGRACADLLELAVRLGGSISGEHGVGTVKAGHLASHRAAAVLGLDAAVKRAFDPKGLFNPGKKE